MSNARAQRRREARAAAIYAPARSRAPLYLIAYRAPFYGLAYLLRLLLCTVVLVGWGRVSAEVMWRRTI